MRAILLIGAAAIALHLSACGPMHQLTPAQDLEQADTAASLAYAATATLCDAYAAAKPDDAHRAAALKDRAWALLQQERELYAQGQSVAALVDQLRALQAQAKALGSTP